MTKYPCFIKLMRFFCRPPMVRWTGVAVFLDWESAQLIETSYAMFRYLPDGFGGGCYLRRWSAGLFYNIGT